MMNNKDKLVLMLTPEHLSMASVRGKKIIHTERLYLESARWEEAWNGGLHLYDQPLRQLLARFGGSNKIRHADIFYKSPGSVCRVDILESDEITAIAKMKNGLKQSVGRSNPASAIPLIATDECVLMLGIADEEQNLQKLFAWLNRSKVVAHRIVPRETGVIDLAMREASRMDEDTAVLYFSSESSVIGYCEAGEPKLARLIEIGYSKLSSIYSRITPQDQGEQDAEKASGNDHNPQARAEPISTCNESMNTLFEHGIPMSKGKDSAPNKLQSLMPAMSPVLQRVSIEIKQTFRFASSLNRVPSKLVICGPGAAIPNIGAAISQSLDMNVEVIPESKDYLPAELFGEGTIERAAACQFDLQLELMPRAAKEIRIRKGMDSLLKLGAVAATLFIGGQYFYASHKTKEFQQVISNQSGAIELIEQDRSRRSSIQMMAGSIGTAAQLIEDNMGNRIHWVEFLSVMPNEEHPLIQVSELQGRMNGFEPAVNLMGVALDGEDDLDASRVLSEYIKALRSIPEVKRIEIGSTSKSMIDESTWGLSFTLAIQISQDEGRFTELVTLGHVTHGDTP